MPRNDSGIGRPEDLDQQLAVADELVALVRTSASLGGGRGDSTTLLMLGAVRRGFQRLVPIRDLAADGAGQEAMILARSLLSILARALYADAPDDAPSRKERFDRLLKRHYQDIAEVLRLRAAAGFVVDPANIAAAEAEIQAMESRGVKNLPTDRQLFEMLDLDVFFARGYAPASDAVHFSLMGAVGDLIGVEDLELEAPDWPDAQEALGVAMITFGLLLVKSEKSLGLGVGDRAGRVLAALHDPGAGGQPE